MSKEKPKPKYSYDELKEKYIDRKVKPIQIFNKDDVTGLNVFITFIINLVVLLGFGFLGGYFLDRWLKTTPIFMVIFIILGVLGAFRNLISWYYKQEVKHEKQQTNRNKQRSKSFDDHER